MSVEKVSVVIPVYGQWHLLKRNIDALLKYDRDLIAEIVVVDDLSPDKNPYIFDNELITILTNEKNKGYAGTVNVGLKRAQSRLVVLLDSDAYPIGPFIAKMTAMYNADPVIGCIGFGTIDDAGNDTGNFQYEPSIWGLIAGQQLEAKFGHLRFWRNKNILPYSCAVSFTKACLEDTGYLDEETFPVLDSDLDISMIIHRSRWKLVFTRDIIICHKGGNSYKINYKRVLLFHQSRWRLFRKHNMIMLPGMARSLIRLRVNIELMVFKFLAARKPGDGHYADKLEGRMILKQQINLYK